MTAETFRPRRSVLYMPSSNERALEKAKSIPCDGLILDLEDAVAPDAKPAARDAACAAVRSGEYGRRELTIRINGADTEWHDADMAAACAAGPDAIVVPKVNSADAVLRLVEAMAANDAPEHTKLWAMVETPYAMLHAEEIAAASDRLTVLVMGTNDLAKELYAEHVPGRQPLLTGLSLALLAARATGKAIIDGVYNDVKNTDGFLDECRQGREMGFDGKTLIHPGQVSGANEAFAPSEQAVEDARGILQAWEDGKGSGVVTYNGRMVENLHVESAQRTLDDARGDQRARGRPDLTGTRGRTRSADLAQQVLVELTLEVPHQHLGLRVQHPLTGEHEHPPARTFQGQQVVGDDPLVQHRAELAAFDAEREPDHARSGSHHQPGDGARQPGVVPAQAQHGLGWTTRPPVSLCRHHPQARSAPMAHESGELGDQLGVGEGAPCQQRVQCRERRRGWEQPAQVEGGPQRAWSARLPRSPRRPGQPGAVRCGSGWRPPGRC